MHINVIQIMTFYSIKKMDGGRTATNKEKAERNMATAKAIYSSLCEKLALSREKDEVIQLASEGNIITKPQNIVKQATVLEFLGLDEKANM